MNRGSFSLTASAVALCLSLFAGCSENNNPVGGGGGLPGTWNLTRATWGSVVVTAGGSTMTNTLTINSNGTYQSTAVDYGVSPAETTTEAGTWTSTSTTFTPTSNGTTITMGYSISGSTLTLSWTDNTSGTPLTISYVYARQ